MIGQRERTGRLQTRAAAALALVLVGGLMLAACTKSGPRHTKKGEKWFKAQTAQDHEIDLSKLKGEKNIVLVFFRERWCTVCHHQMAELQRYYHQFQIMDAEVIGVSADTPANAKGAVTDWALAYPIVSDPDRELINAWDVYNPEDTLAKPSTFIIDKQGEVVWQYVGETIIDRPSTEEIREKIKALEPEKWVDSQRIFIAMTVQGFTLSLLQYLREYDVNILVFLSSIEDEEDAQFLRDLDEHWMEVLNLNGQVVALTADPAPGVKTFVREERIKHPVIAEVDPAILEAWEALDPDTGRARPTVVVLNRDGSRYYRSSGFPWDLPETVIRNAAEAAGN